MTIQSLCSGVLATGIALALAACDKNPYDQPTPDSVEFQRADRDRGNAFGDAIDEAREPEQNAPQRSDLAPAGGAVPQEGPLPNEDDRHAAAMAACRALEDADTRRDCEREAQARREESRQTEAEGTRPATSLEEREGGGEPIRQGRDERP
ncbi:hypothetical protein [Coralloluteibacterium thermophilus]|uniref:Uncharacterized protein n=1 Tax=Coralloluteibacterium thermophilum TaxID=2707049 RepID=A0ABV9NPH5_9GAMM